MSPHGMLAVVNATIGAGRDAGRAIAILKLEMDAALRFKEVEIDGDLTQEIAIEEVTLNRKAKTFKAALFNRAASVAELSGLVADEQADPLTFGHEIAEFFMKRFLGCKHRPTADRATAEWFARMAQAIDGVEDPEKKFRYTMGLASYIESPAPTLVVEDYLTGSIDPADRDELRGRVQGSGGQLDPIIKETTQVSAALRNTVVEFEGGMYLRGPSDVVKDLVQPEGDRTVIKAAVRHVRQRR